MPVGRPKGLPKTGGRKPGTVNKVQNEIKALAQQYGPQAVATLAEIMLDVEAPHASRVAASKELIDRGYGKAVQAVEHSGLDGADLSLSVIFRKADK